MVIGTLCKHCFSSEQIFTTRSNDEGEFSGVSYHQYILHKFHENQCLQLTVLHLRLIETYDYNNIIMIMGR